jgi:hypothetical protein
MMGLKMYTGSGAKKSRSDSDKFKGWSEEDKQFDKFRLSFLVLSIIRFLRESVWRPSCNQLILTMKNTPSGGDGLPPSPERAIVVESTATEDTDSHFSEKNPSRLEELQKSKTAANTVCHARNPEITSPGLVNKLPSVPKSSEGEEKEDLEESDSGMAIMANK